MYGSSQVDRITVTGEPQRLTEIAYLDEIRNLGYEPVKERDEKKAKSFFHMMNWLKKNPEKLIYAKTGWPRLQRYNLFRSYCQKRSTEDREKAKYLALQKKKRAGLAVLPINENMLPKGQ